MLFVLYTSGSTGKPKGRSAYVWRLHGVYGLYLLPMHSNTTPRRDLFLYGGYWLDIPGTPYMVYGPLSAVGATTVCSKVYLHGQSRPFWEIVEKYKVNILCHRAYRHPLTNEFWVWSMKRKDLSSLQKIGTVGEPINEEA